MRWKTILQAALMMVILTVSLGLVVWNSSASDGSEEARWEAKLESLRAANRAMSAENRRLRRLAETLEHDPVVLEQVVREELGYIRDGEVVIVVPK